MGMYLVAAVLWLVRNSKWKCVVFGCVLVSVGECW